RRRSFACLRRAGDRGAPGRPCSSASTASAASAPAFDVHAVRGIAGGMAGTQMAAEMREQPGVIAALVGRRRETIEAVRGALPAPLGGTILIGRGSSDNAAIYGRYLIELLSGRPVVL